MIIGADIGNSSTKVAWVAPNSTDDRWLQRMQFQIDMDFENSIPGEPASWFVTSVNQTQFRVLSNWIATSRPQDSIHKINRDSIPLVVNTVTPDQVGIDRLVAAFAATRLAEAGHPILVIDSGTATTVDLVLNGSFEGGAILPGLGTLFRSLSANTDALPDLAKRVRDAIDNDFPNQLVGKSTNQAIQIGVMKTHLATINEFINAHLSLRPDLEIYATGGGVDIVSELLPANLNIVPDLVLRGTIWIGEQLQGSAR